MFLLPALAALREEPRRPSPTTGIHRARWNAPALVAVLFITLVVGYRNQVGGDWLSYLRNYDDNKYSSLKDVLELSDPGYSFFNWLSAQMGLDIYGVNLFCGAIFAIGLVHFCLSLPRPWLALLAAVPYMLIVVAMGYSRQAVALGCTMMGLVALRNQSNLRFIVWVLLGATFHKTAIMMLPIVALANSRSRILRVVLAGVTTFVGYLVLLQDSFDSMYLNYVGGDVQSEGALIRLSMNAVASLMLLRWQKLFQFGKEEKSLWQWMAWISVGAFAALLIFSSASTALDRMALYLLPVQLVVSSQLPSVFRARGGTNSKLTVFFIIGYFALVQFVWLVYANYSTYWLPYRFYPLEY